MTDIFRAEVERLLKDSYRLEIEVQECATKEGMRIRIYCPLTTRSGVISISDSEFVLIQYDNIKAYIKDRVRRVLLNWAMDIWERKD